MTDQPPERPQVDPSPVLTVFNVGSVQADDGSPVVVLQVQTPVGNAVYFLDPGIAVQVGNALRAEGKKGVSRLAVPSNGLVVPGR